MLLMFSPLERASWKVGSDAHFHGRSWKVASSMGLRLFGCGVAKAFRSSGQPWDSREDSSHLRDVQCGRAPLSRLNVTQKALRPLPCALRDGRVRLDERQSRIDIDAVWLHWRMHLNTIDGANHCEWLRIKEVWLHSIDFDCPQLKWFWLFSKWFWLFSQWFDWPLQCALMNSEWFWLLD